ncbi:MAG: hypothetical protein L6R40_003333 [Gallowayella cf. fulva]|nr:MAG: hypothetical protein L6R40_003333 [Xanthomendoza cf. fulva]
MAKRAKTQRAKQSQRRKTEPTERVKESKVTKSTSKKLVKQIFSTPSKHGMRTRAKKGESIEENQTSPCNSTAKEPSKVDDDYYTSLSQEIQKVPRTPRTPRTSRNRKTLKTPETPGNLQTSDSPSKREEFKDLGGLLRADRSFWDLIRESDSSGSPSRTFADDDLEKIMKRLNNQIRHKISNKIEDYGYLSSSSPSGHDPREQNPVTEEEEQELQLAIWPSIQHLVELTKSYPDRLDLRKNYLDQLRALRDQLQWTWQIQGHATSAPQLFQLEAWKGGIINWRSSFYTDGEDRFPASTISEHLEAWRAEMPSLPSSPYQASSTMRDTDGWDLEMQSPHPRHHIDTSSPLRDRSSKLPPHGHRRVMSALYDDSRDIGFLPTPAQLQSYQAGTLSSTTLPFNSMSDPGMPIDTNSSSDPILESYYFRGNPNIRVYEGEDVEQQQSPRSDDEEWQGYSGSQASATSDKENDVQAMESAMEEQRREARRTESPSNSQDNIDPAEERRVRGERLGELWDVEMEMER